MSPKNLKKKAKLEEKINQLEADRLKNLTQKTHNSAEISLSTYSQRIQALKQQIAALV